MTVVRVDNRQRRVSLSAPLKARLVDVIERTLQGEGRRGEVGLSLVDDVEMQELNQKWRGVDRPTDVLSFPMDHELLLGDVVISLERAKEQAKTYGHSLTREACFLAVHGTLHLLGYDHQSPEDERAMMGRCERVLEAAGLPR